MDDGGNRQHGRIKADQLKPDQFKATQGQRTTQPPQPSMKQIVALMAERDAAIHERNMAISERKTAIAERDMAFLQRDSAIAERNNAIMERDNAFETLQYVENSMASSNVSSCTSGSQITHGIKHMPHPHQNLRQMTHMYEGHYEIKEMQTSEDIPVSPVPCDVAKSKRGRRPKEVKATPSNKKTASKSPRKLKREKEGTSDENMFGKPLEWKNAQDMVSGNEDLNKQLVKSDRKQELGHDEIAFDEKTMPPPGCSCTGDYRQCYKWGHGGWQSSCCTTSISMYPLPTLPNKRHARVGGRKMSGSAYSKLLGRLAAAGHDLSNPIDLKNHWAKHGTNRYITIK